MKKTERLRKVDESERDIRKDSYSKPPVKIVPPKQPTPPAPIKKSGMTK